MIAAQMLHDDTHDRLARPPASLRAVSTDLAYGLVYHWRVAVAVAAVVLLAGLTAALLLPMKFRSESRLLAMPAELYEVRVTRDTPPSGTGFDPDEVLALEMQILESGDLHRDVASRLYAGPDSRATLEAAARSVGRSLHVSRSADANVVALSYTGRTPAEASRGMATVLDAYFARRADVLTGGRDTTLSVQRDDAKKRLDAIDRTIAQVKAENGVIDIEAQIAGAVALDSQLRQDRMAAEADRSRALGNLGSLTTRARAVPQTVEIYRDDSESTAAVGQMQTRLLELQAKRADLAARYLPKAPQILQADQEIAALKTAIAERSAALRPARRVGRNQQYDTVQDRMIATSAAVAGEQSRTAALDAQIERSAGRLETLNRVSAQLADLALQRDVLAESYRRLSAAAERAKADASEAVGGSSNVRIVEAPTLPSRPVVSPVMLFLLSIPLALMLGAIAAWLAATLRLSFLTSTAASRATGLPLIGAVPRSDLRQAPVVTSAIDRTAAALKLHVGDDAVVAIVSPSRDSVLWRIGAAMAGAFNWRAPGRTVRVEFEPRQYADWQDAERLCREVASFAQQETAVVHIGSRAWALDQTGTKTVADLKTRYGRVIIVAPPANSCEVIGDIVAVADHVVVVVEAENTGLADVNALLDAMGAARSRVAGMIFAGERDYRPRWMRSMLRAFRLEQRPTKATG